MISCLRTAMILAYFRQTGASPGIDISFLINDILGI